MQTEHIITLFIYSALKIKVNQMLCKSNYCLSQDESEISPRIFCGEYCVKYRKQFETNCYSKFSNASYGSLSCKADEWHQAREIQLSVTVRETKALSKITAHTLPPSVIEF